MEARVHRSPADINVLTVSAFRSISPAEKLCSKSAIAERQRLFSKRRRRISPHLGEHIEETAL
jgi:hypothetical protein